MSRAAPRRVAIGPASFGAVAATPASGEGLPVPRQRATVPAIAIAQTCPIAGDVEANVAEHLRLATLAVERGARIVLFPELSLTGYELGLAERLAFAPDDARLDPLRALARSTGATLVVGAPVRLRGRLHIAAPIMGPDGAVRVYTKRRLGTFRESARADGSPPPAERSVFAAGRRDPLVRVDGVRAAVAICADVGRPAHAGRAAARHADLYLASMFVIPSDHAADEARLRGIAKSHGLVVAFANFGGPSGGLRSAGSSAVWSSDGTPLVRLPQYGAGVGIVRAEAEGWAAEQVMPDG